MSNLEQNKNELNKQGGLDNSNNKDSTMQNISAIENDEKDGIFQQESTTNVLEQNKPIEDKKSGIIINIRNDPQNQKQLHQKKDLNEEGQFQKVPGVNNEVIFNLDKAVTKNTNPIKSSRKYSCHVCCRKFGFCFIVIFAIINIIINITVFILLIKIYNRTEYPLTYSNINLELLDTFEVKTGTLAKKMSLEEIDYKYVKSKKILRYLSVNCDYFDSKLKLNKRKLDEFFILDYEQVNRIAYSMIYNFISCFILFCFVFLTVLCGGSCIFVSKTLAIISYFGIFAKLILFIVMLIAYFNGTETNEFLHYYESCLDDSNKNILLKTYEKLNKLNKIFIAFRVLYIIGVFLNLPIIVFLIKVISWN